MEAIFSSMLLLQIFFFSFFQKIKPSQCGLSAGMQLWESLQCVDLSARALQWLPVHTTRLFHSGAF